MTDEIRLPPRDVAAALEISAPTVGTWAKRGLLDNFDAVKTDKGKARMFSLRDSLALALMKEASQFGVLSRSLAAWAPRAAGAWLQHRGAIRALVLRRYAGDGGRDAIAYNDDAMAAPPEPGAIITLSFDLDAIFGAANAALQSRFEEKPNRTRAVLKMEEMNPLLTDNSLSRTDD